MIDFIKGLLRKSPARVISYGGGAAVAGAVWLAGRAGVVLSVEAQASILAIATVVLTEAIRLFVYSPNTVERIQVEAAVTGEAPPISPPLGEPTKP